MDTSENVSFWRAGSSRKQSPKTPFLSCNHFGLKYFSTGVSTRGWQSFSIKDQVANILGFVGHTVCVGTAPLSHCRKQAAIENTATARSVAASNQTLFMDVVFLKFYIFTCHKIVFFFTFLKYWAHQDVEKQAGQGEGGARFVLRAVVCWLLVYALVFC